MNVTQGLSTTLDRSDYKRCLEFVLNLYYLWDAPRGDFRSSGQERDIGKYINDHIGGKLAEVAVQKILAIQGLDVKVGFERYTEQRELHQGDIEGVRNNFEPGPYRQPNLTVQIKETKPRNRWWTIPWNEWTRARQDVYVLVRVGFPLDHLIRHFKPNLCGMSDELLAAIPESLAMNAVVEAVYYQDELERIGGFMEAGKDWFFDGDNLIAPSVRGHEAATLIDPNRSSIKLDISSQPFSLSVPARYYEKKNAKSVSKYLRVDRRTVLSHSVLLNYELVAGIYQVRDKPVTLLREDNLGIHCRNVRFNQGQWDRMIREL